MAITVNDGEKMASCSGGMRLDARKYTANDLKEFASPSKGAIVFDLPQAWKRHEN